MSAATAATKAQRCAPRGEFGQDGTLMSRPMAEMDRSKERSAARSEMLRCAAVSWFLSLRTLSSGELVNLNAREVESK